ncbi:MAG TPA: PA14 domain-containing protein, partial [Cytophagales bacterium]
NKTARPLPIFGLPPALRDPDSPTGTAAGLDYGYYEGTGWTAVPDFATLTPVKTGTVGVPDLSIRNREDNYAFRFTGYVQVPTDGVYTFYTTSDDGSKLFIGNRQIVFNDGPHGATEASGTIGLKAGKHAITISFFEVTGDQTLLVSYAGPGLAKTLIPASAYSRGGTNGGGGTGLRGEYYNNKTLAAPSVLVRTDAGINLDNLPGSPAAGVNADNFSVRWTGQVEAPVSGSYTFSTVSDDGIRLWVNGTQLVNNWTDHAATTNTAAAITLTGGQKYSLTLEYYEALYGATAKLQWAYPGQATQLVPASRLYPAAGGGGGGTTTYLSDLTWTSATTGYGTLQKDKSIDSNPIKLNGITYAKGIGTHGASTIVYNLGGNYTSFLSDIGLDDEVDAYSCGVVAFEVYLDNVLAYSSGNMNGSTATKSINLNVSGKNTLRLEVLLADGSNSCDHADWASARLVSGGSARLAAQRPLLENPLSVYPNPATDGFVIRYRAAEAGWVRVTVSDVLSRPAYGQEWAVQPGINELTLTTEGLPKGSYIITLTGDRKRVFRRLSVQ